MISALRGLYIHIPFCSVKCFYCDFTAFSGQRASVTRYLSAIDQEAGLRKAGASPIDTLYIGGGTPSELSAQELRELIRIIESRFGPISGLRESTIEVNPETLTPDRLEVLNRAGITRISIGLQTVEPRLLKAIGRRHTVEQFIAAYQAARKYRFSLNVDLMIGLPSQTLPDAMNSLNNIIDLQPDHISQYCLQIEDQTLFAKRGTEVDEDLCREMFERSLDRLAEAGFKHYEISNFAKSGHESIHNMIYWRDGEYLGLGCGASGHLSGVRYSNAEKLNDYCGAVERGELPEIDRERLEGREKLGETLFVGLRLIEGMRITPEMSASFSKELAHVESQGWLRRSGSTARLTREGIFLANRVFQEFVPPYSV